MVKVVGGQTAGLGIAFPQMMTLSEDLTREALELKPRISSLPNHPMPHALSVTPFRHLSRANGFLT